MTTSEHGGEGESQAVETAEGEAVETGAAAEGDTAESAE